MQERQYAPWKVTMNRQLRLGLTMRVVEAEGYHEIRDALAHDWYCFMQGALPAADWMPVPNLGNSVKRFVSRWGLNGFILTGGNDLFEKPLRDETELAIIEYAEHNNMPLLGVCRGLQVMCHYFGQKNEPCPVSGVHVATRHPVTITNAPVSVGQVEVYVNSYHDKCVVNRQDFCQQLIPFAFSNDGLVEAAWSEKHRFVGVMWHPEREKKLSELDGKLIRKIFDC